MATSAQTRAKTLRSRIKEATSQEILRAAEVVLAASGVVGTTMANVAREAGVSVGTLYNYFADRDELLRVLHLSRRRQFHETLTRTIDETRGQPFEARLTTVVRSLVEQYESHRDLMRIIFSGEMPAARGPGSAPLLEFADRLLPLLDDGIKQKALARADARRLAASLASLLRGMLIVGMADGDELSDAVPFVTALFLRGAGRAP